MNRAPMGRWDNSQAIDIFLPGVKLASLSEADVFKGGNQFAIETQTGWEIFQAAFAELIAPDTYRLAKFLRGQNGSVAEMMDVVPEGARIVWLNQGWETFHLSEAYIGETVVLGGVAAGRVSDDFDFEYLGKNLRPLAPVHVKSKVSGSQLTLSWIRQSRVGGENWTVMDVALGEELEHYRIELWVSGEVISIYEVSESQITLDESEALQAQQISISQGSRAFGWGTPLIIDTPSLVLA